MKVLSLMAILLSTMLLAACTTQTQKIPDDAVFHFETYGGLVPAERAKQVIIISSEQISYIISSQDNKVTESFQKTITKEQYVELLKLFNDKNFLNMKDTYSPPKVTVLDAGNARITANFDNTTKSVTLEPYFLEYYSDNVKIIAEKMQSYINTIYDIPEDELKLLAEEWIRNAPTYSYDGSELQFKDITKLETYPATYVITYSFKSGGYGDRSKIVGIQLITDHEIILAINRGKIVGAIIDGKWNELKQEPYEKTLKFQPLQCVKTPWRKWYDAGNIQFIKAPSEEELVIAYYGQVHRITVQNFKLVSSNDLVKSMCGNNESYYFTSTVMVPDKNKMIELAWKELDK